MLSEKMAEQYNRRNKLFQCVFTLHMNGVDFERTNEYLEVLNMYAYPYGFLMFDLMQITDEHQKIYVEAKKSILENKKNV